MKVVFGTVVYDQGFRYVDDFIQSLNQQNSIIFDVILLNDNLSDEKLRYLKNNLEHRVKIFEGTKGLKPSKLRVELIKRAISEKYDLLIQGDFDDTFSSDRLLSMIKGYDNKYGFFYNDVYDLQKKQKFFRDLPDTTINVAEILEKNYLGLSNTALNLHKLSDNLIKEVYRSENDIFDWYMFTLFLLHGLKGKKVSDGKTFYRLHEFNIAGKTSSSYTGILKEIDVKIRHYSSLRDKSFKFEEKLIQYEKLKESVLNSRINIMDYIKDNDFWWGMLNIEYIESGVTKDGTKR